MIASCRKWDMLRDWALFKQPKLVLGILKGDVEKYADESFYDLRKDD